MKEKQDGICCVYKREEEEEETEMYVEDILHYHTTNTTNKLKNRLLLSKHINTRGSTKSKLHIKGSLKLLAIINTINTSLSFLF